MDPLLEFLKAQKPELAEIITAIDSIQSLEENSAVTENNQETIDTEAIEIDLKEDLEDLNENTQLARAKMTIKRLNKELKFQDYLIENLASALGACNECFGLDNMCENCDGFGVSGFFVPEFKPFNKVIAPAIKRMNLHLK